MKTKPKEIVTPPLQLQPEENGELIRQQLRFMKEDENWDNVKQLWHASNNYRNNYIKQFKTNNIFYKWPSYKFPLGY